ncbi:hypothetical protein [Ideonella sp.]|uniref:hypothetical protein n=1 Tax=Ideonella sp. TaxID=1929293 RepID=UPI0035AFEE0C
MSTLPPDHDDELRPDARLRSALQHAPDEASRPPAALRNAVLQAARAALPPRPSWWQRLLGLAPGQAGGPRLWAAAAGVGAFGLALNLAWHLSTAPTSPEFEQVAAVSEAKRAAPLREEVAAAPPPQQQQAPSAEPPAVVMMAPAPARRDAAPVAKARAPARAPATAPAPVIVATASPPPPAPAVTAPPAPALEAEAKALAKEERANTGVLADAAPRDARARSGLAQQATAPAMAPAAAPAGVAAAPAPADVATGRLSRQPAPLAATQPAAPMANESPTSAAPADKSAAPGTWPPPLARFSSALNDAAEWPPGWQVQGPAEMATPRRAWWQAMLAGTAGRWQAWPQALPPSVDAAPAWRVHGPDGAGFTLTLAEGHAWLQAGGQVWRAPWTVAPPR